MPYKDPAAKTARAKWRRHQRAAMKQPRPPSVERSGPKRRAPKTRREHRLADRRRNGEIIVAAKGVPCADCGDVFHYACMDFDHVRGEKRCDISKMRGGYSERLLREEISKCEVVCANCHRLRTFSRLRGAAETAEP